MAKILSILQLIFVVLVILPGLQSAKKEIKCYLCSGECSWPSPQIKCNTDFPNGTTTLEAASMISKMDAGNNKEQKQVSIINQPRQALPDDTEFICFKYVNKVAGSKDLVIKGCATKSSMLGCGTLVNECNVCDSNFCNAAGSMKFMLTMLIVPLVGFMFSRAY
ncbi:uncharacterized protein [Prorops nasuta]|uniref:uncharacterized protein n=1 Tax=Prorops nasuta TaxID=863751 RepID=UPI0034CDF5BD